MTTTEVDRDRAEAMVRVTVERRLVGGSGIDPKVVRELTTYQLVQIAFRLRGPVDEYTCIFGQPPAPHLRERLVEVVEEQCGGRIVTLDDCGIIFTLGSA